MSRTGFNWYNPRIKITPDNFGINYGWQNNHDGTQSINWLGTNYSQTLVDDDLTLLAEYGIKKIRAFCQIESVMSYADSVFTINEPYATNLDDFLDKCNLRGISVILAMGEGNYSGSPASLDGHFRWDLPKTSGGRTAYANACVAYVNRFKSHTNILMWEINNEPYAALTWSVAAIAASTTKDNIHDYLVACYNAIKPLTSITVGFSDYEEEEQDIYKNYSSAANRVVYIDDCTDIYSMHIYRSSQSQVFDFRNLTKKPKWCVELGSYNFIDVDGSSHGGVIANHELYKEKDNFESVIEISRKLQAMGFSLIMPWSICDNNGIVNHVPVGTLITGTHIVGRLLSFIKGKFDSRTPATNRIAATHR